MKIDIQLGLNGRASTKKAFEIIDKFRKLANDEGISFGAALKHSKPPKSIQKIEKVVCDEMGKYLHKEIKPEDLYVYTRKSKSAMPRQIMFVYLLNFMHPKEIATKYGIKQRGTILYAKEKIPDRVKYDSVLRRHIENIEVMANIEIL